MSLLRLRSETPTHNRGPLGRWYHAHSPKRRCVARPSALGASDRLSVFSPSKINLFLRIMGRRPDGFHDLASLFHVIDLGDRMEMAPIEGKSDRLTCNIADIPTDDSNLVIKALNLYRSKTDIQQHFDIDLQKTVPHGAGLGGGSANAATTLWAANEICGNVALRQHRNRVTPLVLQVASNQDLLDWSGEIGSDISVFFSEGAAYCTGPLSCGFQWQCEGMQVAGRLWRT